MQILLNATKIFMTICRKLGLQEWARQIEKGLLALKIGVFSFMKTNLHESKNHMFALEISSKLEPFFNSSF